LSSSSVHRPPEWINHFFRKKVINVLIPKCCTRNLTCPVASLFCFRIVLKHPRLVSNNDSDGQVQTCPRDVDKSPKLRLCAVVLIRNTVQNKLGADLIQNYLATGADMPVSKIYMENIASPSGLRRPTVHPAKSGSLKGLRPSAHEPSQPYSDFERLTAALSFSKGPRVPLFSP
jgi:hypothetical protein